MYNGQYMKVKGFAPSQFTIVDAGLVQFADEIPVDRQSLEEAAAAQEEVDTRAASAEQ